MTDNTQPKALALADELRQLMSPDVIKLWAAEAAGMIRRQHARIAELEAQLEASGFTAADMATASAQGFRDGVASLSANAGEPRALNPRHIRKFLQALQAGEMSVSRAVEILDAWVGGYYEDEMVPLPPPDSCLIADDEFPMEIVRKLRSELAAAPPTAQAEWWRPPELEWDEVFDCAVAAYCRSSTSHDALRLCFQSRNQQHQISCGWTANELMDFARGIARLYSPPTSAEGVEHG